MRPKNAREREVTALSRRITDLTLAQKKWLLDEVMEKRIYTSGRKCWCTYCGEGWTEKIEGEEAVCPHCGARAKVYQGRHTTFREFYYARFFQVYKGWQIIRYVLVKWECRQGEKPSIEHEDVIQKWCQPGQPMITLSRSLGMMSWYRKIPYTLSDPTLSIKPNHGQWYGEWMKTKTYPRMSLLPVYVKHLGRHPDFDEIGLYAPTLLGDIFGCPYLEKLWKDGNKEKLIKMWHWTDELNRYWPSIKVALRHGYEPEHWGSYFEHLKALKFLRYDMHSPRYVAPPDFGELHDLVMRQFRNKLDMLQQRREEARALRQALAGEELARQKEEDAKKSTKSFSKWIAKFAGLEIADENIIITPLMSIEAFKEEGNAMHHCVFTGAYYKKDGALILSARTREGNERVETIEVNTKALTIVQSMGAYNRHTDKHDEICNLVKKAMPKIRRMAIAN